MWLQGLQNYLGDREYWEENLPAKVDILWQNIDEMFGLDTYPDP